jgi:tetratricopeptide (TPR) repeat protein
MKPKHEGEIEEISEEEAEEIQSVQQVEKGAAEEIAKSIFVDVELEELVKLPGIGPLRAKILFEAGYTDLRKLKQASVVELMNIRGIGRKAAGEIKTALREHTLEEIRETQLTEETVGSEFQCELCGTIVSAYETSCYECGCMFKKDGANETDSDRLALSYYDSKLLRTPDNKDLWYARGATLVKMNDLEHAISSFNRALEIDPSFQAAWMSKADVYNKMGDASKAAECYSHIITSASGGEMPGAEGESDEPDEEEEELSLEPPAPSETAPMQPEPIIAEPTLTKEPVEQEPGIPQETEDFAQVQMDYTAPKPAKPDYDSMTDAELKKELSKRASLVKPYLALAKDVGIEINHAKKLISRAVTESKQNELKVAIQLMDEGIDFAEAEFRRKIGEDIENLAAVLRELKVSGKNVSAAAELLSKSKSSLESGEIVQSVETLKKCLENVETIAS